MNTGNAIEKPKPACTAGVFSVVVPILGFLLSMLYIGFLPTSGDIFVFLDQLDAMVTIVVCVMAVSFALGAILAVIALRRRKQGKWLGWISLPLNVLLLIYTLVLLVGWLRY